MYLRYRVESIKSAYPVHLCPSQTSDEGSPLTKGEVAPAISTSDDVIGPEMTAIETVVKQLHLDSWQVDNTQQVKIFCTHLYRCVCIDGCL